MWRRDRVSLVGKSNYGRLKIKKNDLPEANANSEAWLEFMSMPKTKQNTIFGRNYDEFQDDYITAQKDKAEKKRKFVPDVYGKVAKPKMTGFLDMHTASLVGSSPVQLKVQNTQVMKSVQAARLNRQLRANIRTPTVRRPSDFNNKGPSD